MRSRKRIVTDVLEAANLVRPHHWGPALEVIFEVLLDIRDLLVDLNSKGRHPGIPESPPPPKVNRS